MDYELLKVNVGYIISVLSTFLIVVILVGYAINGWKYGFVERALIELIILNTIGWTIYYFLGRLEKYKGK